VEEDDDVRPFVKKVIRVLLGRFVETAVAHQYPHLEADGRSRKKKKVLLQDPPGRCHEGICAEEAFDQNRITYVGRRRLPEFSCLVEDRTEQLMEVNSDR